MSPNSGPTCPDRWRRSSSSRATQKLSGCSNCSRLPYFFQKFAPPM
jgi:hypothetical protein